MKIDYNRLAEIMDYEDEEDILLECNGRDAQRIKAGAKREYKSRREKSRRENGRYF